MKFKEVMEFAMQGETIKHPNKNEMIWNGDTLVWKETGHPAYFGYLTYDSAYWEVIKEWSLTDRPKAVECNCGKVHGSYLPTFDVKKCRDLILKDINSLFDNDRFNFLTIKKTVNKRFGDL